jgi:hypothetical protein
VSPIHNTSHTNEGNVSPPVNYEPSWKFFWLRDHPAFTIKAKPSYWEGATADWADLLDAVDNRKLRVAILPERSGLVILDCDVSGELTLVTKSSAVFTEEHGIDHLNRVAAGRGKELPPTYTVRSPSGGLHLYYGQNEHCPVRSHGHRPGWLIDVKASPNTYAVAPPTPGYEVIRDLPVAVLPYWLARHIRGLSLRMGSCHPRGRSAGPLTDGMREGILRYVAQCAVSGGWNNAVYWAACRFIEADMGLDEMTELILGAAPPWDEAGARRVRRTIESAWEGQRGEVSV